MRSTNIFLGCLRLVKAALPFPLVTLVTCMIGVQCLYRKPFEPFARDYGFIACAVLTAIVFVFALFAVAEIGASGVFGQEAAVDMRSLCRRMLFKHVLWSIAVLAPLVALGVYHDVPPFVCIISVLCLFRMIDVTAHVEAAIIERTRHQNLVRFVDEVGAQNRSSTTKGIRRK